MNTRNLKQLEILDGVFDGMSLNFINLTNIAEVREVRLECMAIPTETVFDDGYRVTIQNIACADSQGGRAECFVFISSVRYLDVMSHLVWHSRQPPAAPAPPAPTATVLYTGSWYSQAH